MRRPSRTLHLLGATIASAALAGCASTPAHALRRVPAPHGVETDLARVAIDPARDCVVTTVSGDSIRGRVVARTAGAITLAIDAAVPARERTVPDADIVTLGRIAGASRLRRGWIGAAIAAIVAAPFGISMPGDMTIPAAIAGAQIARRTGDERIEILLDRRPSSQRTARSTAIAGMADPLHVNR